MNRTKKTLILLCASFLALSPSFADTLYYSPEENPIFKFNVLKKGDFIQEDGEIIKSERKIKSNEIDGVVKAGNTITKLLRVNPTTPAEIKILGNNEYNASAYSSPVEINGEEYSKTLLNAWLNNLDYIDPNKSATGLIFIGLAGDENRTIPWDSVHLEKPIQNQNEPNLYPIIQHELYHALGMSSNADENEAGEYRFTESPTSKITIWDSYLRVFDKNKNLEIKPNSNSIIKVTEDGIGDFDIYNNLPYFVGDETMKVLSGIDGTVEECQEEIKKKGGIASYQYFEEHDNLERLYGLPINGIEIDSENGKDKNIPELSHIELRSSLMSHQTFRNWNTLMEAELAVLKDIGYKNIEIRDYFGKSFYLDGNNTTWSGNNDNIGYGFWDGTKYTNAPSETIHGVGLHIYSNNNIIRQEANILSKGEATIGTRIDGSTNTYTLADGYKIDVQGENSIGLATMWGKNHTINLEKNSEIKANGVALCFDFGKSILGGFAESTYGSYIKNLGDNLELNEELNGSLINNLNIDGLVEGTTAAIYIADNALVDNINIMKNSQIKGDIISNWNGHKSGTDANVQNQYIRLTNINFGVDKDGNSDSDYSYIYQNNILGNNEIFNTISLNILGGELEHKNSYASVYDLNIKENATLTSSSKNVINNELRVHGNLNLEEGATLQTKKITNSGEINVNTDLLLTTNINAGTKGVGNLNLNKGLIGITDVELIDSHVGLNGSDLNLIDDSSTAIQMNKLTLNKDTQIGVDLDLKNLELDTFSFENTEDVIVNAGKINVEVGNIANLKTALTKQKYEIDFINEEYNNTKLKDSVTLEVEEQRILTPIYKYNISNSTNSQSALTLARSNKGNYKDFNSSIFASPIAAQVGGYLTQLHSYDMAFANMDMTMQMTKEERLAMKYRNKYAMASSDNRTNLMTYSPNQIPEEERGLWFKPFATFEKVGLKNGPEVENQAYGSFFGGDTEIIELKKGWDAVFSGYAGYTGSHQRYDGNNIYQNGGNLGATGVFYKGDFFTGLTANIGASCAEASTMYGDENMTLLMSGIASKTGYNFQFLDNKMILQPNWLMSYSFVNTFDYTNAAGVKINSDPLHAIQLVPGVKIIGNLKNGWQPYGTVQMAWNLIDDTEFKAQDANLPNMSVKPYVQYGVGVQKRYGDKFTGYGQTLIRNGGRNGVSLSFGFRWALGK